MKPQFPPPAGVFVLVPCAFLALASAAVAQVAPLLQAHAHNDYYHPRPLLDALDHGFCSVEADIHLVDGKLLVAHDRHRVQSQRSLEALYLEPLRDRVRRNSGRVYPGGPEFALLIDLKTHWTNTYPVLRATLENYADMLTTFAGNTTRSNAVRVILSGSRSREMLMAEKLRLAALDGDLADLDSAEPASLIPWISSNWSRNFKWRGGGAMPHDDMQRLKDILARAQRQGRRVRFWGAPDQPAFWAAMRDAGVDVINTDNLSGLENFLRGR